MELNETRISIGMFDRQNILYVLPVESSRSKAVTRVLESWCILWTVLGRENKFLGIVSRRSEHLPVELYENPQRGNKLVLLFCVLTVKLLTQ